MIIDMTAWTFSSVDCVLDVVTSCFRCCDFINARFMVCSRHMSALWSAPTALKETRLRLTIHLLASNRKFGSGFVSGSYRSSRMFPMYMEHQRR